MYIEDNPEINNISINTNINIADNINNLHHLSSSSSNNHQEESIMKWFS